MKQFVLKQTNKKQTNKQTKPNQTKQNKTNKQKNTGPAVLELFIQKHAILKAYSLMLNRGRCQNFQNLFFLYISVALL